MPSYHVQIRYKKPETEMPFTDYELDLTEEDVVVLGQQYQQGQVFFKGTWIDSSSIQKIEIRRTPIDSIAYLPKRDSAIIFYGDRTDVRIVTRQFIKSPPKKEKIPKKPEKAKQPLGKDIFIVHGRDHRPLKELKGILGSLGLNPIVLHEKASGSRTIVEKLEKHSNVGYAFVILTPDDVGGPSKDRRILRFEGKERARQNVILEFGYFMGKLGRDRVCCLYKGDVELPSDMHGIVYIPFKKSVEEVRDSIVKELKEAGYEIKM